MPRAIDRIQPPEFTATDLEVSPSDLYLILTSDTIVIGNDSYPWNSVTIDHRFVLKPADHPCLLGSNTMTLINTNQNTAAGNTNVSIYVELQ